jgi:cysteine desulfurase
MVMWTLYFDHSATTPPHEQVIRTMAEVMAEHYANPGSLHRAGGEALKLVERARASVAEWLGAKPQEVVFTSGGTESNNLAIKGIVGSVGRKSKHVVTSAVEHASVYECIRQLEETGVAVTVVPVDGDGRVSPERVRAAVRDDTVLVSIMHVNNETGAVQPIRDIGEALSDCPHVRFHVDGVQAVGKIPVAWKEWRVDLYTGSAHKFRGPKGVGFLLVREGVRPAPLNAGGGQEHGLRSGTPNVPGIVAAAQALRLAMEGAEERRSRWRALRRRILDGIREIPELVYNGSEREEFQAPHIVNLSYPGMRPEVLVHVLEKNGVLVSTQSACSSRSLKPSRVLKAMGFDDARASGSIRISMGDEHDEEAVGLLLERLKNAVAELRPLAKTR